MPDASGRETNNDCRDLFTNCPESRTANIVLDYANNNARWHQDFGPAFQILLEHGYPDGHLVAAGVVLPQLIDPTINTPTNSALSFKVALLMVAVGVHATLLLV